MRRAVLVASLLVAAMLVVPAAASPQPTPVCRFCGAQFEEAATDAGINTTVAASDVHLAVEANGSATWTVRVQLETGADAFAAAPDRLRTVARSLNDDGYGLPHDASFVDVALDGDVVVLRYRVDHADRYAGLLVVDVLHDRGYDRLYHVNADRFTIQGPAGSVVANTPESGQVDGDAVTWQGVGSGESAYGTPLEGSPYVVFGPDRSAASRLRAAAAVTLATWPVLERGITRFLLFQTAVFALLLAVVVAGFSRWTPRSRPGPLLAAIGVLGVLGIVIPAATHGPRWITGPPLLAVGVVALASKPAVRDRLRRPSQQSVGVAGVLLVAYGLLVGLHVALGNAWTSPAAIAVRATALAFPFAAMIPLGAALAVEPDRVRPWVVLAVLAFGIVPVTVLDLADPPTGLAGGFFAIGLFGLAVVAPLLGTLGLALGWSMATVEETAS